MTHEQAETEIKALMYNGIYNQNEIFNRLYPTYNGHYGTLRDLISKLKNDAG